MVSICHKLSLKNIDRCINKVYFVTATKRLIASESMSELHFAKSHGSIAWEMEPTTGGLTPPGTPPPPYLPGQNSPEHTYTTIPDDDLPPPVSSYMHEVITIYWCKGLLDLKMAILNEIP